MSDIFINTETSRPPRPDHGNNCHGHFTSIAAGGNGHSANDGCGCDGLNPETPIDFIAPILLVTAIILIYRKFKTTPQLQKSFKIYIGRIK